MHIIPQQHQIHRGCSLNIGNIVIILYVMQQFAHLGFDKNAGPIQKYNISYYAEQMLIAALTISFSIQLVFNIVLFCSTRLRYMLIILI